jgi:hypothetical protein
MYLTADRGGNQNIAFGPNDVFVGDRSCFGQTDHRAVFVPVHLDRLQIETVFVEDSTLRIAQSDNARAPISEGTCRRGADLTVSLHRHAGLVQT